LNSPDLTDLTAQLAKAIENFRKAEQEMLQELVDQPAK
jgi:hypothetical protein